MKRGRYFSLFAIFAGIAASLWLMVAGLLGAAAPNEPDLSQIESRYLLAQNRTLFPGDGFWWAASTDGASRTILATLTQEGESWVVGLAVQLRTTYQRALESGGSFYFLRVDDAFCLTAYRWRAEEQDTAICTRNNVQWDSTRQAEAMPQGILRLVTALPGGAITDSTPLSQYFFNEETRALEPRGLPPEESSSIPEASSEEPASSEASEPSSFPEPSASEPFPPSELPPISSEPPLPPEPPPSEPSSSLEPPSPSESGLFFFRKPITVAQLREEYTEPDGEIMVITANGRQKEAGHVVTGDLIRVERDNGLSSVVTACILGDLGGCGAPDNHGLVLLRDYLVGKEHLTELQQKAADMDENGEINTADILLLRKFLHQAD